MLFLMGFSVCIATHLFVYLFCTLKRSRDEEVDRIGMDKEDELQYMYVLEGSPNPTTQREKGRLFLLDV